MKRSALPFQRGVRGGIRMWRAWSAGERLSELAAAPVGHGIVGHDRLDWAGSLFDHPCGSALEYRGGDLSPVVAVDLDVGQTGVIVDHDVRELDPRRTKVLGLLAAIAVRPVQTPHWWPLNSPLVRFGLDGAVFLHRVSGGRR
jgi:hypothetical protein